MRRALLSGLAALVTMALLFGLFNLAGPARAQEEKPNADQKKAEEKKPEAPAPPKSSPEAVKALETARKATREARDTLEKDRVSNCCTKPGCALCILSFGRCPCAANLAQNKGICPECWGAWYAGRGALPGEQTHDKDNQLLLNGRLVRVTTLNGLKSLYEARDKELPAAEEQEKPAEKAAPKAEPAPKDSKVKKDTEPPAKSTPKEKPAPKKDAAPKK